MSRGEIHAPKDVRPYMPDWAEETTLGEPQGSQRQYRYGNLHIREYDDWYAIHTDEVDPRKDPLGHLVRDAPEVLIGAGCGLAAGALAHAALRRRDNDSNTGSRHDGDKRRVCLATAAVVAAASGYASYTAAKKMRRVLAARRQRTDGKR